ncbi:50S ribosomal protein L9 [Mobiluncus mulieris]|uniref:Large ribosomal subunit protein bL9 n=2 Tax=Mobiluncus mulieris TaxID=2052 RepID=E0QN26_9ACTO|nr:50S ribosomal protein L9 [Mobiluncus mulieris]EFM46978.1 ribosomal protein L9 [Mobiluncus mulieris ATCC 35239]EFN94205.1 ribosomal protein L9 [Mobiluncus mulieris FB024-16]MBB5847280.1 large subunit ribosomal protein L9 [Mobiluncus mulieris]MCU9995031.1 50S ribosomal protein L9 [Mobiluncus mulieris]MCU9996131.1 50S ribosomal protein L9 [Mobiluncus mulieris]
MTQNTKVILTHEVEKLGVAGDVVEVRPGYARNYLIPRRMAMPWTKGSQTVIDRLKASLARQQIASMETAQMVKAKLTEGDPILIDAKAGANGRLFGSITTDQIAKAAKAQKGVEIDKRKIMVDQPLKAVGTYQLTVRLFEELSSPLEVIIRAAK